MGGGARDGDGDEVVDGGDVVAEGVEIGGGGTRGVGGISAAGTAMVTYNEGEESLKPKFKVEKPSLNEGILQSSAPQRSWEVERGAEKRGFAA